MRANVHHVRSGVATALTVLLPHDEAMLPIDWTYDGCTTQPDFGCMALTAKKVRCPKEAVVTIWVVPDLHPDPGPLDLCGGHFGMHRRGREVPTW